MAVVSDTSTPSSLSLFTSRLRQLIDRYKEATEERERLRAQLTAKTAEAEQLHAQVSLLQQEYAALKMARLLTLRDGDLAAAKARVSKIIRDLNRCITYINDKG